MDLRFMPAMPDADSLRFSDHERILARPTANMLADFRRHVRRDCAIRDLRHYRANVR